MDSLVAQLSSIERSEFEKNDEGRFALMKAAQGLFDRLERPHERIMRMIWVEPWLMIAVRTACDLDLFAQLSKEPQTSEQLSSSIGADPALISRLLRLLGTCHLVGEIDVDTYVENEFSASMIKKDGIQNGIYHYYDIGIPQVQKLPHTLKVNGYQNPADPDHPPWEQVSEFSSLWQYYKERPEESRRFHNFLASTRPLELPWTTFYPVSERLLQDYDPEKPLLVDVGGSTGADLAVFHSILPLEHQNATLVLEDLPEVIEAAKKEPIPPSIQPMAHSFFTPQPAATQGAKAYFLHSILHDWHDNKAVEILSHLKNALTPGYSRILLMDVVLGDRVADNAPLMVSLDIVMMSYFSAQERTEKQWSALAEQAGLKVTGIWGPKGNRHSIVELELL